MEDKVKNRRLLLVIVVGKNKKKNQNQKKKNSRYLLPSAQLVSLWALLNALLFAGAIGIANALVDDHTPCSPSSLGAAQDAEDTVLEWCTALQAAVAALALLLPGRRRQNRWALALVALLATAVGHCIHARFVGTLLADDPGYLLLRIFGTANGFIFFVCDLLCFLGLLMGGECDLYGLRDLLLG